MVDGSLRPRAVVPPRWTWTTLGIGAALLGMFAWSGPTGTLGFVALAIVALVVIMLGTVATRLWIIPILTLTLLAGQVSRGIHLYELVFPLALIAALIATIRTGDRRAWDIGLAGLIGLAVLAAPLMALPGTVISSSAFIASYKLMAVWVLLFYCLRRIVPADRSVVLLWVFPLVGACGALQLIWKTQDLGALVFARLGFRNFYTRLPWGQSDFISATMEFCLCMTVVLFLLDRRPLARLLLVLAAIPMCEAFLLLFSRAGAIALVGFLLVLSVGLGGRRGVSALLGGCVLLAAGALTPGGQVMVHRFTDPAEYLSWYARLIYWGLGWERFLAHPWTGIGLNQGKHQHDLMGPHPANNLFLDAMIEQGILGGIMLVVVLVAAYRMAGRVAPAGMPGPHRPVRIAIVAALTQVVIHASVEPTITGATIVIPFVFLLAWLSLNAPARERASA